MARKVYEETYIANIAEKIREKTGGDNTYKTSQMPSGIDEVYEKGKQEEYDAFWDNYQQNGTRKSYAFAFAGMGWTPENFRPKYDIKPKTKAKSMFAQVDNMAGIDLEQTFKDLGITFDTSGVTHSDGFDYFVQNASPSVLPAISTVGINRLIYCFNAASDLKTIRKLILKADGSQTFNNTFTGCANLENIEIEGTIGQNGFDIHWSTKLSKASITSIINALSTTTSGLTITLSKTAVNSAFETSEGASDGSTSDEWLALIATKQNWTISLA